MKIRSYFGSATVPAIFGLLLGELLMTRMFVIAAPVLGGLTFLTVELIGAFLIDFPLACISAYLFTRKHQTATPRDGLYTGAAFLTLFLLLIIALGILHSFTSALDVLGLYAVIVAAVQAARAGFQGAFQLMLFAFLAFDYLLCMTGGLVGFTLANKHTA